MAINELVYNNHTFSRIRSAKARFSESVSLSTLPVDTLTVTVVEGDASILAPSPVLPLFTTQPLSSGMTLITAPQPVDRPTTGPYKGSLSQYSYGEVVYFYHSGSRVCKFYLESIKQVGKWDWTFNCISPVGMLITSDHYGGVYTGQKAKDVIADIIGGIVPYTLDSKLEEVEVFGWLPKASRRNNLRDVLFAVNAAVEYNSNGDLHFYQYGTQPEPKPLTAQSFYLGGSVNNGTPATAGIVIEHNFIARSVDETVTLFDGEALGTAIITPKGKSVTGVLVEFKEPIHDLKITGASILESNPNYAVISSTGYANLTGQRYTHTERQVVKTSQVTSSPNIVQSSKCTLIGVRNSEVASNRVIAFYGYAYRVQVDLLYTDQKCGDYVTFTDPYGSPRVGYIETMDLVFSKEIKASASIVCGFIPPYDIPMYLHSKTFTSNTTWTVPEGVTSVRVVCIGGGSGGTSGHKSGSNNPNGVTRASYSNSAWETDAYNSASEVSPGRAGDGGAGGEGGSGGKIYSTSIEVTPGQQFQVVIGSAGVGGSGDHVAGSAGGETKFGSLSSNSGASSPFGYAEELTGVSYAMPGSKGIAGAKGVDVESYQTSSSLTGTSYVKSTVVIPPNIVYGGVTYTPGQSQETGTTAASQSGGSYTGTNGSFNYYWEKGFGGGASAGANGSNGSLSGQSRLGGAGGIPPKRAAASSRGNGGDGGHGQGGPGATGGQYRYARKKKTAGTIPALPSVTTAAATNGTNGGDGGNGAAGICFIYYYSPKEV